MKVLPDRAAASPRCGRTRPTCRPDTGIAPRSRGRTPRRSRPRALRYVPIARIAFGPPKSPTTGTTRLRDSRSFRNWKPLLGRQVAAADAGGIRRRHQIGVGRVGPDVEPVRVERLIDGFEAGQIVGRAAAARASSSDAARWPSGSARRASGSSATRRRRENNSAAVDLADTPAGTRLREQHRDETRRGPSRARRSPCTSAADRGCRAGCRRSRRSSAASRPCTCSSARARRPDTRSPGFVRATRSGMTY